MELKGCLRVQTEARMESLRIRRLEEDPRKIDEKTSQGKSALVSSWKNCIQHGSSGSQVRGPKDPEGQKKELDWHRMLRMTAWEQC